MIGLVQRDVCFAIVPAIIEEYIFRGVILGGNEVCRAKGGGHPGRHVVQVADGGCHDVKSSCHSYLP